MRVGIYNSCRQSSVANLSCALLAQALAVKCDVEIIGNSNSATSDRVAETSGAPQILRRTVEDLGHLVLDPCEPAERYEFQRQWSDELTSRYDLFINLADRLPILCSAPSGVLVVQSPYDFVPAIYRSVWIKHLASYQLKLTTSYYTRFWTRVLWDIECSLIYPPTILDKSFRGEKDNAIVLGGPIGPRQHQLELLTAFLELKEDLPNWFLIVMGEVDHARTNKKYCDLLRALADDASVSIVTNPSPDKQMEIFRRSKILWRASGLGIDMEVDPKRIEPFAVDVLQAMANGCVPLVTNSGSLSELIRHRETGIFWDSPDELVNQTVKLAKDEARFQSLSEGAHARARAFSSEKFTERFLHELKNAFGIRVAPRLSPAQLWKRVVRSADQFLVARR